MKQYYMYIVVDGATSSRNLLLICQVFLTDCLVEYCMHNVKMY